MSNRTIVETEAEPQKPTESMPSSKRKQTQEEAMAQVRSLGITPRPFPGLFGTGWGLSSTDQDSSKE